MRLRAVTTAVPWRYALGFGVGRLATLVVLPVVSRATGADGLGRLEVALAVMVAATIVLDAGLGTAVVRFREAPVAASAAWLQAVASLAAAAIFTPLIVVLAPAGLPAAALAGAVVVFAVVEGFAALGGGLLRAEGRDDLYLRYSLLRFAVTAGAGAAGTLLLGEVAVLFAVGLGGLGFAAHALRAPRRAAAPRDRATVRRLAGYGPPLMATTVTTWALSLADRLFLEAAVSARELGGYAANYRLGSVLLTFLAAPMALAWLPVIQQASAAERPRVTRRWLISFSAICALVALPLVGGAGVLVPLVFGAGIEADRLVVALVCASGWLGGLYYLVATPLLVGATTWALALASLPAAGVNLLLNALLIPPHGGRGAAVATLGSFAVLCAVTGAVAARRGSAT